MRKIYGLTFVWDQKIKKVQLKVKRLNYNFRFYFKHLLAVFSHLFLAPVVSHCPCSIYSRWRWLRHRHLLLWHLCSRGERSRCSEMLHSVSSHVPESLAVDLIFDRLFAFADGCAGDPGQRRYSSVQGGHRSCRSIPGRPSDESESHK